MATIKRVKRNTPFVQIDKTALQDKTLSWKAKGVLAYLLSLPDDWQIYLSEIKNHARDGKDATRTAVDELVKAGYITRKEAEKQVGRFAGYNYTVSDFPQRENNRVGFSATDEPQRMNRNGKSATTNNIQTNKVKTNTIYIKGDGENEIQINEAKGKRDAADGAKTSGLSLETKLSEDQDTPKSWAELAQMANKASNNDLPDFVSLDDIEEDEVKVINLNPSPKDRKEAGEQMAAYYRTEDGRSVLEVMCYAAGVPFDIAAGFMDRLCVKWALKQTPYVLSNWMGEVSNLSTWIQNEYKSTAKPSGSTNDNKLKIVKNGTDENQSGFRTSDETVQRAAELSRQRRKARKEAFGL